MEEKDLLKAEYTEGVRSTIAVWRRFRRL